MRPIVLYAYLTVFSGLFAYLALSRPIYNWDMIGYAAAVYGADSTNASEMHGRVFETLRAAVPDKAYVELVEIDDYRRTVAGDPESLRQHIPFYGNRILYVWMLRILSGAGVPLYTAMRVVALVFTLCGIWLMVCAFRHHTDWWRLLMIPWIAVGLGALSLARIVTPDAMAFAAIGLGTVLLLRGHRTALLISLPLMVLVRPDLLLFAFVACAWLMFFTPAYRSVVITSALVSVALFVLTSSTAVEHGWKIYVRNAGFPAYPLDANITLSFQEYFVGLLRACKQAFYVEPMILYAAMSVILAGRIRGLSWRHKLRSPLVGLSALMLVYVVLHVIVHPLILDRFFVGMYVAATGVTLARHGDITT